MKIEKLPSGSYRVRKMYKGQKYTLTFEFKPTQKEVLQALAEKMENGTATVEHLTFKAAANKYLEMKRNVLSPSTLGGYNSIIRNLSEKFCSLLISDITAIDIQKEINDYSVNRAPKTVQNANGFITAVIGTYRPDLNIATTLPQKEKQEIDIPTDEEMKRILQHSKGSKYEIPLLLATFGLRRSEICALTPDDLDGNILTINKALVLNDEKKFVIKTTKTTDGTRKIYISDYLANLIRERGGLFRIPWSNLKVP